MYICVYAVYLSFNWSSVPGAGCTINCNDDISCYPKKDGPSAFINANCRTNNSPLTTKYFLYENNAKEPSAGEKNMTKHSRHTHVQWTRYAIAILVMKTRGVMNNKVVSVGGEHRQQPCRQQLVIDGYQLYHFLLFGTTSSR